MTKGNTPYKKKRLNPPTKSARLPNYHDFIYEVYGKLPLSEDKIARLMRRTIRAYHLWIFCKLAEGQCVNLYNLFTIFATKRAERHGVGNHRVHQPEQYILKLKPTEDLKPHLKRLAADKTKKYYDYTKQISPPPPGTSERLARDSRRRVRAQAETLLERLRNGHTSSVHSDIPEARGQHHSDV